MPAAKSRRTHPYSERYRIRRHDRCDRCGGGHRSHASLITARQSQHVRCPTHRHARSVITHFSVAYCSKPLIIYHDYMFMLYQVRNHLKSKRWRQYGIKKYHYIIGCSGYFCVTPMTQRVIELLYMSLSVALRMLIWFYCNWNCLVCFFCLFSLFLYFVFYHLW